MKPPRMSGMKPKKTAAPAPMKAAGGPLMGALAKGPKSALMPVKSDRGVFKMKG